MLEYSVKKVITNPTLMTKSNEIIKIVDNRSHQVKAFILPISYTPLIEKLEKEAKFKQWVEEKKQLLAKKTKIKDENIEDIMESGIESIDKYLKD